VNPTSVPTGIDTEHRHLTDQRSESLPVPVLSKMLDARMRDLKTWTHFHFLIPPPPPNPPNPPNPPILSPSLPRHHLPPPFHKAFTLLARPPNPFQRLIPSAEPGRFSLDSAPPLAPAAQVPTALQPTCRPCLYSRSLGSASSGRLRQPARQEQIHVIPGIRPPWVSS
jgi:hypothetical protein